MNSTDPFEAIASEHYEALYRFARRLTRADANSIDPGCTQWGLSPSARVEPMLTL